MHDHILQFTEKRSQPDQFTSGFSYFEDTASTATFKSISTQERMNTPASELPPQTTIGGSPVLPGTGSITHNITRMLSDSNQLPQSPLPGTSARSVRYSPYSTAHFMSFRHKMLNANTRARHETDGNQEQFACNNQSDDIFFSTNESISPSISSARSSPVSFESPVLNDTLSTNEGSPMRDTVSSMESSPSAVTTDSSPSMSTKTAESESAEIEKQPKKKARTNYSNEQVHALLKIFHETPYPDSEMMENIGKDLGIPEKKVKIWFQNKRARWRRRVNENVNNFPQPYLPMSPMLSPVTPYGYMPPGSIMTSSPIPRNTGYYPWMQLSPSIYSNHNLPGQLPASRVSSKFQGTEQTTSLQNQSHPILSVPPAHNNGTLTQHNMAPNQTRLPFQYPSHMLTQMF